MGYPKYSGLAELLKHDRAALDFFKGLPMDTRDAIAPNGKHIDSFETLKHYAEAVSNKD